MGEEELLTATELGVKHCRDLRKSLWYGVRDLLAEFSGAGLQKELLRENEFWALQQVSLRLRRGDCLGVIGPNGAGKTTLLKVLAGLYKPDQGVVCLRGRVASLIELGTGFSPVLTGRENIFSNGALLGLRRREIEQRLDRIIAFAELNESIDAPIRSYSSGMALRLAFAVAVHLEADILLLDEILAVGDVGFRAKCYGAMQQLLRRAAVVFVSHAMPQIARLCNGVLVLKEGRTVYAGADVPYGIQAYYGQFSTTTANPQGDCRIACRKSVMTSPQGDWLNGVLEMDHLGELIMQFDLVVAPGIQHVELGVLFHDQESQGVAQALSPVLAVPETGKVQSCVQLSQLPLGPGRYAVALMACIPADGHLPVARQFIGELQIRGNQYGYTPVLLAGDWNGGGIR